MYTSPYITGVIKSIIIRFMEHVERMENKTDAYRVLAKKPNGKRTLGTPRGRWEGVVKMNL